MCRVGINNETLITRHQPSHGIHKYIHTYIHRYMKTRETECATVEQLLKGPGKVVPATASELHILQTVPLLTAIQGCCVFLVV